MKKELEKAEVEVVKFEKEDVIATSPLEIGPIGAEDLVEGEEN